MPVKKNGKQTSGKFVLRIPSGLHKKLKDEARNLDLSLNTLIIKKISNSFVVEKNIMQQLIIDFLDDHLLGIILFGSVARHENKKNSDIDLLLILKPTKKINRQLYQEWENQVAHKIDKKISPQFVYLPDEGKKASGLWLEIALDGEILFDIDNQIKKFLCKIKNDIADGKYIRKNSYGQPYWIQTKQG